ncbi:TPA: hypothetical protein U0J99_001851 [Streptococcus suis]|nr:hypothetical protein [Streptococcus suis]
MKEHQHSETDKRLLTRFFSRRKIEILSLFLVLVCALSVFTGRIGNKQALTLDNGKLQYNGYVVASKMNGQGKLTFENGDSYQGQFKNGIFHGKGTYTSASGWTYVGEFKNGYADGQGKLTTEGKAVYEGRFKQGIYQNEN